MKLDARKTKVIVAMSGGVDSSVVTAIAQQEDFEVIGATLRLKHPDENFSKYQSCANKSDEEAISLLVEQLKIQHHYIDEFKQFERLVLRPSAEAYLNGSTPNPCCLCNPQVKFGKLLEFAQANGAEYLMTGHYAKICEVNGQSRLARGVDSTKDQTYFLYRLTPEQLSKIVFPLGEFTKADVRELAESMNLSTAKRPDSQDACFSCENECFGETLRRLFNLPPNPGVFTFHGKIVGKHNGIHQYTIGQRKGLGVALGAPAYVIKIHPSTGEVELDTDESRLDCSSFYIDDCVWHEEPQSGQELLVQVRYRSKPVSAQIIREHDKWRINLSSPQRAITPGQSAVCYIDDLLLGGGIIHVD